MIAFAQLQNDLTLVLNSVPREKVLNIAQQALKDAGILTVKHKVLAVKDFITVSFNTTKALYKYVSTSVKQNGVVGFFKELPKDVGNGMKTSYSKMVAVLDAMSSQEKIDTLTGVIVFGSIAILAGGGLDFEGGLPDSDLMLGIGNHRNLFSYTIATGLVSEFTIRFLVQLSLEAEKAGYTPQNPFLRAVLDFAHKHHEMAINGMWFGMFVHYLKDSKILSSAVTKPYVGLDGLTMQQHKNLFATNALLSAIFSTGKTDG